MAMGRFDPVALEVFKHLFLAIPEEMGGNLRRAAFSPNIKERLDESCAIFDHQGRLLAQAEHIPVHLGAMPTAVKATARAFPKLAPGDQIIVNDPYQGGSHLPDITVIAPFFWNGRLKGYAVNRAHHADVGGKTPGSMPGSSHSLEDEGIVIAPTLLVAEDRTQQEVLKRFQIYTRNPQERMGDLNAQIGSNRLGVARCTAFIRRYGEEAFDHFVEAIMAYSRARVHAHLTALPDGAGQATDTLDGNGSPITIAAAVELRRASLTVDFTGTSPQSNGNENAPLSVTRSAVYYVLRCLLPPDIPPNDGCYDHIRVRAPEGCLLNPRPPAAVSSGNVETSQRIVDVLLLALQNLFPEKIPAQGQGTMNNLAMGWPNKTYYETIAGGMGGSPAGDGASAVQVHMTNTANTPVEALESAYPLQVLQTALREGSEGTGQYHGGMGITKVFLLLKDTEISIQSERRRQSPKGIRGGKNGKRGINILIKPNGEVTVLPGRCSFKATKGSKLVIKTPGGGGWGSSDHAIQGSSTDSHATNQGHFSPQSSP